MYAFQDVSHSFIPLCGCDPVDFGMSVSLKAGHVLIPAMLSLASKVLESSCLNGVGESKHLIDTTQSW